jgi:deoxyribodipyrimidine photo-lyase
MTSKPVVIFWFRRDLRWDDNTALYHALSGDYRVLPLFIFDKNILDDLEDPEDARLEFIHNTLVQMNQELKKKDSSILFRYGSPLEVIKEMLSNYSIVALYANRDYEPYARQRDKEIYELLQSHNIPFHSFKDHVIFERKEVMKDDGTPYVVFTPYSRKWKSLLTPEHFESLPSALLFSNFYQQPNEEPPSLEEMGFKSATIEIPSSTLSENVLDHYHEQRDYPAAEATSRLGIHLRFGTISIRKVAARAYESSDVFLNELIWREFYQMILWHFPKVVDHNFHQKYDNLEWRNNKEEFERWCNGQTGYPIVDAGMRQMNQTGFMHNRVRMIVASFLTKHLLIDWRWGEAYFAKKLLDFELASNNGGWQWAAGTGTDAQPYFRIFNPWSQTEKFDPDKKFIQKWVPEYLSEAYPSPMVDHKEARERALNAYKAAVG